MVADESVKEAAFANIGPAEKNHARQFAARGTLGKLFEQLFELADGMAELILKFSSRDEADVVFDEIKAGFQVGQ